jgi:methyl-accepting chemotaxis protein
MKLNLNHKLNGGYLAVAAVSVIATSIGLWVASELGRSLQSMRDFGTLVAAQLHADMMHDALRGDVLSAIASADPGMRMTIADVRKDFADHVEAFDRDIEAVRQFGVDQAIADRLDVLTNDLTNYISAARIIIDHADDTPSDSRQRLPDFYSRFSALESSMDLLRQEIEKAATAQEEVALGQSQSARLVMMAALLVVMLAAVTMVFIVRRQVLRPLGQVTEVIGLLASGKVDIEPPHADRTDEVGQMSRAVKVFRDHEVEARLARRQQEEEKVRAEEARRKAEREAIETERELVRQAIGVAVEKLAAKDLTFRITDDLPEAYVKLRADFNHALEELEAIIGKLTESTDVINSGTQEISSASDDLSHRTETQASSLEETAAAVNAISGKVRQTASGAAQARAMVETAKEDAARSGEVVRRAIDAMHHIESSSSQITQIISVIDEIAFQTNLLALNAGVEAARAGDAGKGFAVVAQEVRSLAQRSAEAAKEIKALIARSHAKVQQGVELVGETGSSLERIVKRVLEINEVVHEIAGSAAEQSAGLEQVNNAVDQMDQTTQQNAAMVEEATAATKQLARQSDELRAIIGSFSTKSARPPRSRAPAPPRGAAAASGAHRPAPMAPVRPAVVAARTGTDGGAWEEF